MLPRLILPLPWNGDLRNRPLSPFSLLLDRLPPLGQLGATLKFSRPWVPERRVCLVPGRSGPRHSGQIAVRRITSGVVDGPMRRIRVARRHFNFVEVNYLRVKKEGENVNTHTGVD